MANNDPSPRPVPQPRRIHTQTSYENVSLDAINKNIILNTDNLQTTLKPKVPNNKHFLLTVENGNATHSPPPDYRSIITEINNLNIDKIDKNSANKNFADSHKLNNMPVPAPRRLAVVDSDIYENNAEAQQSAQEIYESNEDAPPPPKSPMSSTASSSLSGSPLPSPHQPVVAASTGAIRKTPRRPPQLPLPPPPDSTPPKQNNNQTVTCSGVVVGDIGDDLAPSAKQKLQKSVSNGSLNSSTSGSSSGARFATNSPG